MIGAAQANQTIPTGLYCLRGVAGTWEPSVLCILPSGLTADIDFGSGTGEVVGAGRWRFDGQTIVVEDTVRDSTICIRQRFRRFQATAEAGRVTLAGRYAKGGPGRDTDASQAFVHVSSDLAIDVRARGGEFERRSLSELIAAFHDGLQGTSDSTHEATEMLDQGASLAEDLGAGDVRPRRTGALSTADSPYATNAFRVLGLPTTANARDVSRRAKELAMLADLDGDDDVGGRIRDAEAALADPVRRAVEELLWVRADAGGAAEIDPADRLSVVAALDYFEPLAQRGDVDAIHDVAVIAHAAALEDDSAPMAHWQAGLSAWGRIIADERFWRSERLRAELADDPRLTAATIDALHADLARRILEPTARAIGRLVSQRQDADAASRLAAVAASGLPAEEVARTRASATASLRTDLSQAEAVVTEAVAAFTSTAAGRQLFASAHRAAVTAEEILQRLTRLDPHSAEVSIRADALAEALRTASLRLHNEAGDTDRAASIVERAARIAASESVRSRLIGDARMLRRIEAQRSANEKAGREDWDGAARDLTTALDFADDPAERTDIQQSLRVCRFNATMKRAIDAAEARRWANAIAAAEEARSYVSDAQDLAGIDAFILRCCRSSAASAQSSTAASPRASASSKGSGVIVSIWAAVLALTLFSFTSLAVESRPFVVDGNTIRIRGVRDATVSGIIPTGASVDRYMAYLNGLKLVAVDGATGKRYEQTLLTPSQPNWPSTIRVRAGNGNQPVTASISVRIPNLEGGDTRPLRGQITGNTWYPVQSGSNAYKEDGGKVAMDVRIEVLSNARGAIYPLERTLFGVLGLLHDWWSLVAIALVYLFFVSVVPWFSARSRRA